MNDIESLVLNSIPAISKELNEIDKLEFINTKKVLDAFHKYNIDEACFNSTTGYGYNDYGREKIEKVFAEILGSESALVRNQFVSGSHALTVCLFALLRPNDILLSITGKPYDTLDEVIGLKKNDSSLMSFGVKYHEIDLINNDFDIDSITKYLKNNTVKVVEIQRSKGYSTRKSIDIKKLENIIKVIKKVSPKTIIMVDNCYCEFCEDKTPLNVSADVIIGSLIKNLGGGIAPNGAYIAGSKEIIKLCGERLTLPGEGTEVGPTLGINKSILQGIYLAPSVVAASLKTAVLTSYVMEKLNYEVEPKYNDIRPDIVENIIFHDKNKLINYTKGIQKGSAIDSNSTPIPSYMPGYDDNIIMASGSFTSGSSIELSCDGPLREPYIAYQQGSLTFNYGILGLIEAIKSLENGGK